MMMQYLSIWKLSQLSQIVMKMSLDGFFLIDELLFLSDYPKIKIEDLLNSMVILDDHFLELKDIKFSKNELLIKEVETSISRLFEIIRAYQS
jgi:hypothetical protein